MPDVDAPVSRLSRVTTRRGTLRQLNCPLEPELLVAEFSEELPPDVANAVRDHIAVCEICGKRAQELHTPYSLLASLGAAPAPYVPDLRENVRFRTARAERVLRPLRALRSLGTFGLVTLVLTVVTLVAIVFGVSGLARSLGLLTVQRTTNQLQHVPRAAPEGSLLAETDKLVTLTAASGATWQVAEVIVADQRTGQVTRSLPSSTAALRQASASSLPLDVVTDGHSVYELTSSQHGQQALVAFSVTSGAVRFITPLTAPGASALPASVSAVSLALAPDDATMYIGLSGPAGSLSETRALVLDTISGKETGALTMATPDKIPLPAPPGSLPASAFPSVVPIVSVAGMRETEAAHGAIVVAPDGGALFDVTLVSDSSGARYAIVRRLDLASGQVRVLGLQGNFGTTLLTQSLSAALPEVYVITGSPDASVYVLDASANGPSLVGQIALGGPAAERGEQLQDVLAAAPAPGGAELYVTQDATTSDGLVAAHSRWLVDTRGMGVLASASDSSSAGALLPNTQPNGQTFALINGQVAIGSLGSGWTPWLETNDNTPIIRLIATT